MTTTCKWINLTYLERLIIRVHVSSAALMVLPLGVLQETVDS